MMDTRYQFHPLVKWEGVVNTEYWLLWWFTTLEQLLSFFFCVDTDFLRRKEEAFRSMFGGHFCETVTQKNEQKLWMNFVSFFYVTSLQSRLAKGCVRVPSVVPSVCRYSFPSLLRISRNIKQFSDVFCTPYLLLYFCACKYALHFVCACKHAWPLDHAVFIVTCFWWPIFWLLFRLDVTK